MYKLLKIAAADSDFTKFLRWALMSDKKAEGRELLLVLKHQKMVALPWQLSKKCQVMKEDIRSFYLEL